MAEIVFDTTSNEIKVGNSKVEFNQITDDIILDPSGLGLVQAPSGYDMSVGSDVVFATKGYADQKISPPLSAVLTDNTTTTILTYAAVEFKALYIEYVVDRTPDGYLMGSFQVLTDGTTITSSDTQTTLTDPGVTINASILAGTVTVEATLTSTGNNATIYYTTRGLTF